MDFADQLKSAVDIVRVIGERVPLKRRGHSYIGICPFHQEKSPSFNVHQEKQFYKCFGCGAGGDVIKFVMEYDRLPFMEAVTLLADQYGIPMPKLEQHRDDPDIKLRAALLDMHELAAKHFQQNLQGPNAADARGYLERRGLTPELIQEFRLGYADRAGSILLRLLQKYNFPKEAVENSGLVGKREDGSYYDVFRNRLMFPIWNETGKVIAFGGRALAEEDQPKYRNSSGSAIYQKSGVLYNLHRAKDAARRAQRIVLVEGYMDVIGAFAAGVREAVAPCGTALTAQQVKLLQRYAPLAVVNFDPDAAGANAAEKSIQLLLDEGFRVRVCTLEGGLDPDEYVKANGAEAYQARLESAPTYFYWLAARARAKFDMRTSEGKMQALDFLMPAVKKVKPLERAMLADELAAGLGVDRGLLLDQFRRTAAVPGDRRVEMPALVIPRSEKMLLELLVHSSAVREAIWSRLEQFPRLLEGEAGEIWKVLLEFPDAASFSWPTLEQRLEEKHRTLLAMMAFADHLSSGENPVEQAEACLYELGAADRKQQFGELKKLIREAELRGDIAAALALAKELQSHR